MRIYWHTAKLERLAHNDNRRQRTRADEQFDLVRIVLGGMVLFVSAIWLAG